MVLTTPFFLVLSIIGLFQISLYTSSIMPTISRFLRMLHACQAAAARRRPIFSDFSFLFFFFFWFLLFFFLLVPVWVPNWETTAQAPSAPVSDIGYFRLHCAHFKFWAGHAFKKCPMPRRSLQWERRSLSVAYCRPISCRPPFVL